MALRKVTLASGLAVDRVRSLVCGLSGSGKTHFAATAPKPLFLTDPSEGGYKTVPSMDPALWWDPKQAPEAWCLEKITDMANALGDLEKMSVAAKNFPFGTVVIDPISTWATKAINEFATPTKDNRQAYGELAAHLRSILLRVHALPCHVLWLCHVKNGGDQHDGPALGGQMGTQFPAFCDFAWFCNVVTNPPPISYELRTAPYRAWTFLKGRIKCPNGLALPDPLIPSFKVVAQLLGLREKPASPAVPGFPDGVEYPGY